MEKQMKITSFYFTNEEIKNLVSCFIITTQWLCMNNCKNKYPKREKYCLFHDIEKGFLNCYRDWMTPSEKKAFYIKNFFLLFGNFQ